MSCRIPYGCSTPVAVRTVVSGYFRRSHGGTA